ncbi:MAG: hypothetical protein ACREJG_01850 [Candidatus Rokuibacteriota bacterium]
MTALSFLVVGGSAACDKGPMQEAGESIDRATDQDKLIGKGPVEKAGKSVDETVKDLKR